MYKVGILIIGSLFWDTEPARQYWRNSRLLLNSAQQVYAPIRYGRKSSSRNDTYTMVFSRLCVRRDYGFGKALAVPCRHDITSTDDLMAEAQALWAAEVNQVSSK